jgi:hypothetical protein
MNGAHDRTALLEYVVLDGRTQSAELPSGESWTFGRSQACTESVSLPALSRVALTVQHLATGLVRVTSRQSGMGRVLIISDDDREQHSIRDGSVPVHLAGGNYTCKLELPPVVLRMQLAVPPLPGPPPRPLTSPSPRAQAERTAHGWVPRPGEHEGREWVTVAALAVALARYPELVPAQGGSGDQPVRMSEALRRAAGLWCGHTSLYWVNERLKEAITAADLVVPEGRERLSVVVAHYDQLFSRPGIRDLRDQLLLMQREHEA